MSSKSSPHIQKAHNLVQPSEVALIGNDTDTDGETADGSAVLTSDKSGRAAA